MTATMTPSPPIHAAESAPEQTTDPALRRVIEEQIGPRAPGAIYQNQDGRFEVQSVVRDPEQARELLNRRARWAMVVKDVGWPGMEPFAIGTVWTDEDFLVREGSSPD